MWKWGSGDDSPSKAVVSNELLFSNNFSNGCYDNNMYLLFHKEVA